MSNPLKKPPGTRPVSGICTCKLCGQQFTGPAVLMIKPGQTAHTHQRLKEFMEALARHVIEKHDGHDSAMQMKAHEYLAMLRLLNFTLADRELSEQRDYFRWSVHQATLNATISDAAITGVSGQLAEEIADEALPGVTVPDHEKLKGFIAAKIAAALTDLRKELQEPGKFSVSPVVTAQGSEIVTSRQ